MELGIVPLLDVFNLQHSIAVYINSLESLNADVGSELIHRPDYGSDKFVEINLIVAINVKHLEKCGNVLLINLNTKVVNGLGELVLVK